MRVMLINNDHLMSSGIKHYLEMRGFDIDVYYEPYKGKRALLKTQYDCVVIGGDITLAMRCEYIKKFKLLLADLPILTITMPDSMQQTLEVINAGADENIWLPVNLEELDARLRALIRQKEYYAPTMLVCDNLILNLVESRVYQAGEVVELTSQQILLLEVLMRHKNSVVPKTIMRRKLASHYGSINDNSVAIQMHFLRKKLGGKMIKTVRGVGYKIECK